MDKRYKPVDSERAMRLKEAESKLEQRQIGKGEAAFDKFLTDSTQDAEIDKLLSSIIDERMEQGKTDEQILQELAGMTGMNTNQAEQMTPE